jgi:cytochrome P450
MCVSDVILTLQDIYNNDRVTKSHVYQLTITSGKPSIFNAIGGGTHRKKRRLVGQAITDRAMRSFEPIMIEQVDIFIEQLRSAAEATEPKPLNMTDLAKRLGLDIVGHLAFGFALNLQTDPTYRFVLRGLAAGTYQSNCFMQWPMLKKLGAHNLLLLTSFSSRRKYRKLLQQMIASRMAQEKDTKSDLYSYVVDDLDDLTNGVTYSELWSEALFFFPAGTFQAFQALSSIWNIDLTRC